MSGRCGQCACGCGRDWHARVQGWKTKAAEAQTYADQLAVDRLQLAGDLGVAEAHVRRLREAFAEAVAIMEEMNEYTEDRYVRFEDPIRRARAALAALAATEEK